jgi:hypothetical protein
VPPERRIRFVGDPQADRVLSGGGSGRRSAPACEHRGGRAGLREPGDRERSRLVEARPGWRFLQAILATAILSCTACLGIPDHSYLRVEGLARPEYAPPDPAVTLAAKADRFERHLDRFMAPEGILLYRQPAADPGTNSSPPSPEYAALADAAIWSGALLGAESLRYAVTRDASALARVRSLANGLENLHRITGVRGLLARTLAPRTDNDPREGQGDWRRGATPFHAYLWKGDVSKDQYSGVVFGLGLAAFLVDVPDVRATVAATAAAIADHLIEHDLKITEAGGETTTYGDLDGFYGPVPIGLNALIALSAYKVAAFANPDTPRYTAAYDRLINDGYADAAYWTKAQILGKTNHNNDNMQWLAVLPLIFLERDPALRRAYERSIARTFEYVRLEGNSFANFVAIAALGHDPALRDDALHTLRLYPLERRVFPVDASGDTRFHHTCLDNRRGLPKADGPLPIHFRSASSWAWRDDPYALISPSATEGEIEYPAADYLLAYWLGRYLGSVTPRD